MAKKQIGIEFTGKDNGASKTAKTVTSSLTKVGREAKKTSSSFAKLYKEQRKSNNAFSNITKDANRASMGLGNLSKSIKNMVGIASVMRLAQGLAVLTQSTIDMTETTNLFSVAMGENAEATNDWVNAMHDAFGLDTTNLQSSVGTYGLLARSMGASADQAEILATNTAKLALDLSSLTNVPINQVMQDLRSGLVGQSETVYKYGIDVTEASLKAEALAEGITTSVRNMSQGEKMMLRYNVMLKDSVLSHGDFAKTMTSPANQLKILSERLVTCGRSIGSIFVPMLTAVLPYLNAFVMALTFIADKIAVVLGYIGVPVANITNSFSGIEDGADAGAEAVGGLGASLKKLKQYSLGMDELNVITPQEPSGGGGGGSSGGGGIGAVDLSQYDNLMSTINDTTKALAEKMQPALEKILTVVGLIGVGFLAWKTYLGITGLVSAITKITTVISGIVTGIMLFGENVGAFFSLMATEGIGKTLSILAPVASTIAGVLLTIGGLVLAFFGFKGAIQETSPTIKNLAMILGGLAIAIAGVFIVLMALGVVVTGGAVLIVAAIALIAVGIFYLVKYWDEVSAWLIKAWENIKDFAVNIWTAVSDFFIGVWESISEFAQGIWTSIVDFFKESWNGIKDFFSELWTGILEVVQNVWNTIKDFFTKTIPKIITSIVQFFKDLPYKIGYALGSIIGTIATWIVNMWNYLSKKVPELLYKVVQFFIELPSNIWDGIIVIIEKLGEWYNAIESWVQSELPKILLSILIFFIELPSKIWDAIIKVKTKLDEWLLALILWVKENFGKFIDPIIKFFSDLPDKIWNKLMNIRKTISDWITEAKKWVAEQFPKLMNAILGFFTSLPSKMVEVGKNLIKGLWNGILSVGNWLWNKITGFFGGIWDVVSGLFNGFGAGFEATYAPVRQYASGGFVDSGEMFIAREAGAEMVGSIGGKTAVANNDQIVEAVASGVAKAVSAVMGGDSGRTQEIVVNLDGEVIYRNQQKIATNRGHDFGLGVFAR